MKSVIAYRIILVALALVLILTVFVSKASAQVDCLDSCLVNFDRCSYGSNVSISCEAQYDSCVETCLAYGYAQ
jgi:uncharacterized membrane protein